MGRKNRKPRRKKAKPEPSKGDAQPFFRQSLSLVAAFIIGVTTSLVATHLYPIIVKKPLAESFQFKSISANFSNNVAIRVNEALYCYRHGNYRDALSHIASIESSIGENDTDKARQAFLAALKGDCHRKLGHIEKSKVHFLKSIEYNPSSFAHKSLSEIYWESYNSTGNKSDIENYKKHSDEAYRLKRFLRNKRPVNDDGFLDEILINLDSTHNKTKDQSQRVFLVAIGINDYNDPRIDDLNFAENDLNNITKSFFRLYKSRLFTYKLAGKNATKRSVFDTISNLKNSISKRDRVIVYFSGHGYYDSRAESFLNIGRITNEADTINDESYLTHNYVLTVDSDLSNVEATAIPWNNIIAELNSLKTETSPIFISDACSNAINEIESTKIKISNLNRKHNGVEEDLSVAYYPFNGNAINRTILISSSSIGRKSAESSYLKNGIFTYHLSERLARPWTSDINRDNKITLREIANATQNDISAYLANKDFGQSISIIY